MSLRYFVMYQDRGETSGAEVVVDHSLESRLGQHEAHGELIKRGVTCPHITGWALRSDVDQEQQPTQPGR